MVYAAHVFEGIGLGYMNRAAEPNLLPQARSLDEQRRFRAFFGSSPEVCSQLWDCSLQQRLLIGLHVQNTCYGLSFS